MSAVVGEDGHSVRRHAQYCKVTQGGNQGGDEGTKSTGPSPVSQGEYTGCVYDLGEDVMGQCALTLIVMNECCDITFKRTYSKVTYEKKVD